MLPGFLLVASSMRHLEEHAWSEYLSWWIPVAGELVCNKDEDESVCVEEDGEEEVEDLKMGREEWRWNDQPIREK